MVGSDLVAVLNQHGLTSHQATNLLERLGRIIEMGQWLVKGATHESICREASPPASDI
jgi:hypothetical protein